jgi:hypothetical protein
MIRTLTPLVMLAAITAAIPAAAQERAPEPPVPSPGAKPAEASAPPVNLVIQGVGNGLQVRVLSKDERPAAEGPSANSCNQDCELKLPTGTYTLVASQGERQNTQDIALSAPLRLTVSEPNAALRYTGLTLGIAGILIAAVGTFVTVGILVGPTHHPGDDEDTAARMGAFYGGLAAAAVGTGLIIGGFSLHAANRVPSMEVDRMAPTGPPRAPTGASLSLRGSF